MRGSRGESTLARDVVMQFVEGLARKGHHMAISNSNIMGTNGGAWSFLCRE